MIGKKSKRLPAVSTKTTNAGTGRDFPLPNGVRADNWEIRVPAE
jgi:hypothetical protein